MGVVVLGRGFGHRSAPAGAACDPASRRRAPAFKSLGLQTKKPAPGWCFSFVLGRGFEPPWVAPLAPKASAYTNSATPALRCSLLYQVRTAFQGTGSVSKFTIAADW